MQRQRALRLDTGRTISTAAAGVPLEASLWLVQAPYGSSGLVCQSACLQAGAPSLLRLTLYACSANVVIAEPALLADGARGDLARLAVADGARLFAPIKNLGLIGWSAS